MTDLFGCQGPVAREPHWSAPFARLRFAIVGLLGLAALFAIPGYSQELRWPKGFTYENWCGLDHPKDPSTEPLAVDEIDEACKKHDIAYSVPPWGNADADMQLIDTLTHILGRGTSWRLTNNGKRRSRVRLRERQIVAATTIVTYFTGQQYVTIYSDILDGRFSSVLKLGTSSTKTIVTVPKSISDRLLGGISKEVSDVTRIPLNDFKILDSGTDLTVEFQIRLIDLTEASIDEVGGHATHVVRKIGRETGLDKPIREIRQETVRLLTQPKKASKGIVQKIIDVVLPWRWSKW